jgi:glycosyltransferase involved in cell wall biosynthesis
MKIAILGTRGIPNHYGGFEQFAEYVSVGLVNLGHKVSVYNSHRHPYQHKVWRGVEIIHQKDPEHQIGSVGQFIYDLNCILDVRKKEFDIILQLGYGTSSIWGWLLPKNSVIITNMDGFEWKRTKYSKKVQKFLQFAEKLGVKYSNHLVADSVGIQRYLKSTYGVASTFIPYGANIFQYPDESILEPYAIHPYEYDIAIARLESSNSVEAILQGVKYTQNNRPFLLIGDYQSDYGQYLKKTYEGGKIRFLGPIYDITVLNNLRYFSNLYIHGHTVGGTNPSLLEAMASRALICAHNNIFNSSVLGDNAYYFKDADSIRHLLETVFRTPAEQTKIEENINKIRDRYSWEYIIKKYEYLMELALGNPEEVEESVPELIK